MSANAEIQTLLQDVEEFSEATRDRILKRLPPEDVLELLKASLRRIDQLRGDAALQITPTVAASSEQQTRSLFGNKDGHAASRPQTENVVFSVTQNDQPGAQAQDRAKSEQKTNEFILFPSDDSDEKEDELRANPRDWPREQKNQLTEEDETGDQPRQRQRRHRAQSAADDYQSQKRNPGQEVQPTMLMEGDEREYEVVHLEKQPKDLPMYLRVPDGKGGHFIKDIEELPMQTRSELQRRYKDIWVSNKFRTIKYRGCTYNPGRYMAKNTCIRNQVWRGKRVGIPRFTQGGKLNESADDKCITATHPCAYFVKYGEEFAICIVPLPRALRQLKAWTETSFWVS